MSRKNRLKRERKKETRDEEVDAVAYIIEGLKAGIHPDYLTEPEVVLMERYYGKEWKQGYLNTGVDVVNASQEKEETTQKVFEQLCERISSS